MDADDADSPFEWADAGERTSAAFEILGNETRLEILLALWESVEPFAEDDSLSFSALRSRVGTTDSSQFNYHLDKLVGHFVESTDDGYTLSRAGLQFVQSVIGGAGIADPTLPPTDVDMECTICGGQVQLSYDDGWVYIRCTECAGIWSDDGEDPTGQLAKFSLDPAGLANRSTNEIYAAAWVHGFQTIHGMLEGVCPTCSGTVHRELDVCEEHAEEGLCQRCDRTARVGALAHCQICKDAARMTPGVAAKYHPAVVGFYHDHGLDLQYGFNDLEAIEKRLEFGQSDVDLLAESPPRVRVTHEVDGDSVAIELDADLAVVAVSEPSD